MLNYCFKYVLILIFYLNQYPIDFTVPLRKKKKERKKKMIGRKERKKQRKKRTKERMNK